MKYCRLKSTGINFLASSKIPVDLKPHYLDSVFQSRFIRLRGLCGSGLWRILKSWKTHTSVKIDGVLSLGRNTALREGEQDVWKKTKDQLKRTRGRAKRSLAKKRDREREHKRESKQILCVVKFGSLSRAEVFPCRDHKTFTCSSIFKMFSSHNVLSFEDDSKANFPTSLLGWVLRNKFSGLSLFYCTLHQTATSPTQNVTFLCLCVCVGCVLSGWR